MNAHLDKTQKINGDKEICSDFFKAKGFTVKDENIIDASNVSGQIEQKAGCAYNKAHNLG